MMQIAEALKQAKQQLTSSSSAQLDAELLLCHCLKCDRSRLFAHPEEELPPAINQSFFELIDKRIEGHPVAHLLNSREFWSLNLKVTPDTLIPRPETERLVELALDSIPANGNTTVLDLGTGTGAIAIAIASERSSSKLIATDINQAALSVAKENALSHQITNIEFTQADWFDFKADIQFDVIVSNPPYIDADDPHLQQGDVRFESKTALVADEHGLADIRTIINNAISYLKPDGWLLLEHGYEQGEAVRELFKNKDYINIKTEKDYAGLERITLGQHQ